MFRQGAQDAVNVLWSGKESGTSPAAESLTGLKGLVTPMNKQSDVVTNPGSTTKEASSSSGPDWLSAGTGAVDTALKFVGGLINAHQQKKANWEAKRQFNESLAFAKDQFYNYMQHRVDDALKAGVHPLAALGVSAHGSASPTAHYQAATGLGSSMAQVGFALNNMFENAVKSRQLQVMDTQIAANEALAVKYGADAGRQLAETKLTNKDVDNYHLYRAWNAVNGSVNAIANTIKSFFPASRTIGTINNNYESFLPGPSGNYSVPARR